MKLIAYLVPDDFEDWKLPQGLKFRYKVEKVPAGDLKDAALWLVLGQTLAMALWRVMGDAE